MENHHRLIAWLGRLGGILVLAAPLQAQAFPVEVTELQLQETVDAMMPWQFRRGLLQLVVTNPRLELAEGQEVVGLTAEVRIDAPGGLHVLGRGRLHGKPEYEPDGYRIFLRQVALDELEVDGLPPSLYGPARNMVQQLVVNAFTRHAVYTFGGDGIKQALARTFMRSVRVSERKLILDFNPF